MLDRSDIIACVIDYCKTERVVSLDGSRIISNVWDLKVDWTSSEWRSSYFERLAVWSHLCDPTVWTSKIYMTNIVHAADVRMWMFQKEKNSVVSTKHLCSLRKCRVATCLSTPIMPCQLKFLLNIGFAIALFFPMHNLSWTTSSCSHSNEFCGSSIPKRERDWCCTYGSGVQDHIPTLIFECIMRQFRLQKAS